MSDPELPEYDSPPVVEVSLAVEFAEPLAFSDAGLRAAAATWNDDFPVCEEREALAPLEAAFHVDTGTLSEGLRLWMATADGDRVVQLQQDRLTVNWQKQAPDDAYPRFARIRGLFLDAWERLLEVCATGDLPAPVPSGCDVLYVNSLGVEQGWTGPDDTALLLAPLSGEHSDEYLPTPSFSSMLWHYHVGDEGWLNVEGWGALDGDDNSVLALYLQARTFLDEDDRTLNDALAFMDEAHEWIVRGFTSVTSQHAHAIWGRLPT